MPETPPPNPSPEVSDTCIDADDDSAPSSPKEAGECEAVGKRSSVSGEALGWFFACRVSGKLVDFGHPYARPLPL